MATTSNKHVHGSPDRRADKPDAGPERGNWRDQELTDNDDQHRQEDKLRGAGHVDKGPSACNPKGRR